MDREQLDVALDEVRKTVTSHADKTDADVIELDGQTLYAVPNRGCGGCIAHGSSLLKESICARLPECGNLSANRSIVWMTRDDMVRWTARRLGEEGPP